MSKFTPLCGCFQAQRTQTNPGPKNHADCGLLETTKARPAFFRPNRHLNSQSSLEGVCLDPPNTPKNNQSILKHLIFTATNVGSNAFCQSNTSETQKTDLGNLGLNRPDRHCPSPRHVVGHGHAKEIATIAQQFAAPVPRQGHFVQATKASSHCHGSNRQKVGG